MNSFSVLEAMIIVTDLIFKENGSCTVEGEPDLSISEALRRIEQPCRTMGSRWCLQVMMMEPKLLERRYILKEEPTEFSSSQ